MSLEKQNAAGPTLRGVGVDVAAVVHRAGTEDAFGRPRDRVSRASFNDGRSNAANRGSDRRAEGAVRHQPLHEDVEARSHDHRGARPVEGAVALRREHPAPRARAGGVQQRETVSRLYPGGVVPEAFDRAGAAVVVEGVITRCHRERKNRRPSGRRTADVMSPMPKFRVATVGDRLIVGRRPRRMREATASLGLGRRHGRDEGDRRHRQRREQHTCGLAQDLPSAAPTRFEPKP